MSEQETYPCKCCLTERPESDFYRSKLGHRNPICKECRKLQRSLCRKLEKLGYKFTPSLFVGREKEEILKKLLEGGILNPADIPWELNDTTHETE